MLIPRRGRRLVVAASVLATVAFTAGCGDKAAEAHDEVLDVSALTASDIPSDGTQSADGLTTKDYQSGTLPTDPYRMVDPDLRNYAWDVYVAKCMVDRGQVPAPVISYDWNDPSAVRHGGWSERLSADQASQYGYHLPPSSAQAVRVHDAAAFIASQPASWKTVYDTCYQSAAQEPMLKETVSDDLPFSEGAENSPLLAEMAEKWRECMKPLGIPDLPEDAPGIAPSLSVKYGLAGADNLGVTDLNSVSAEEISVATQDAQCDTESGYGVTEYGLVWVARDRYVKANLSDLGARRAEIQNQEAALKSYIEENRDSVRQG